MFFYVQGRMHLELDKEDTLEMSVDVARSQKSYELPYRIEPKCLYLDLFKLRNT